MFFDAQHCSSHKCCSQNIFKENAVPPKNINCQPNNNSQTATPIQIESDGPMCQATPHGWPFCMPVDPVALGIPDYFDIIARPMDFSTIQARFLCYRWSTSILMQHIQRMMRDGKISVAEFGDLVRLVFHNACLYNQPGSAVHVYASRLSSVSTYWRWITQIMIHTLNDVYIDDGGYIAWHGMDIRERVCSYRW